MYLIAGCISIQYQGYGLRPPRQCPAPLRLGWGSSCAHIAGGRAESAGVFFMVARPPRYMQSRPVFMARPPPAPHAGGAPTGRGLRTSTTRRNCPSKRPNKRHRIATTEHLPLGCVFGKRESELPAPRNPPNCPARLFDDPTANQTRYLTNGNAPKKRDIQKNIPMYYRCINYYLYSLLNRSRHGAY